MTPEQLNTALYNKLFQAQERYRDWLLSLPPEEMLNHVFEYGVRQDILLSLECSPLSAERARALLATADPLSDICKDYDKIESSRMEEIRDTIENRADYVNKRKGQAR